MIYICSDWHFNHNKPFVYEPRGFSSVDEMNNEIVLRHNTIVNNEDEVYCLGDCCLGGTTALESSKELIERLNGKIYIITGNHCSNNRINMYKSCHNVIEVFNYVHVIKYHKYIFYLSHFPTLTSNYDVNEPLRKRIINICGHSHTTNPFADFDKGLIYHAEMDSHNCYPVKLDDIIEEIKTKIKEY